MQSIFTALKNQERNTGNRDGGKGNKSDTHVRKLHRTHWEIQK